MVWLSTKPELENKVKMASLECISINNGPIVPALYIIKRTFTVDYILSSPHTYILQEYKNESLVSGYIMICRVYIHIQV